MDRAAVYRFYDSKGNVLPEFRFTILNLIKPFETVDIEKAKDFWDWCKRNREHGNQCEYFCWLFQKYHKRKTAEGWADILNRCIINCYLEIHIRMWQDLSYKVKGANIPLFRESLDQIELAMMRLIQIQKEMES